MVTTIPMVPVLLVTVAVGVAATLIAWRERYEPGALPLVVMLAGQSWWSTFLIFQLRATTLDAKMLWVSISWFGVVVIPVAWLLFALEYTGRDYYVRPRYVGLASVIPVITVGLALTGEFHELLYVESVLVEQNGTLRLSHTVGPWYWVIAGYTYLLGLLGSIPILELVWSDTLPFRGQSVALLVGTLAPWASNALYLADVIQTFGVDPTPVAFSISGIAYLGAFTRFRLLGTSPSPTLRAPRLMFEQMQEGAVVVDGNDNVVDVNDRIQKTVGVSPNGILGTPAAEIIPEYDRLPADGSLSRPLSIRTETGTKQYDVVVTRISNVRNRTIGRVITFHDISDYV
ncbi:MAG: histidine kinase N-terminal 7TM domain-containing protein, partial [Halobacteriota archaeon]